MNPTIRPTKVLDYYDGVLVFTAEGDDDQHYVGSIIDTTDGIDRYLVKASTAERIKDLEQGRVDLRSLLLEDPSDEWYLTFDGHAPDQPLELHLQDTLLETMDFLPSEGYFLDDEIDTDTRLIEKWLPINEVSVEAIREGGALAGHPPVNQLHVWWARRPLIASRAAVAAAMLPIEAERDRFLTNIGTTTEVVTARRQMDAIKADGGWSDISFPNDRAFKHNPNFLPDDTTKAPLVLDVTAGGGSIPFEAGRLGFSTIANELNPVACHILRATCEWPQKYGYQLLDDYRECADAFQAGVNELLADVYPDEPPPDCAGGNCPHPQRYRCVEECGNPDACKHKKHGSKNHETVRAQRYAQTYLWARTVNCPNCKVVIPLSPNWRLDDKGTGMRVEPDTNGIELRIVHDRPSCSDCKSASKDCHLAILYPDHSVSNGTVTRAIATCPACGSTTPKGYLAQEAQAERMGHRLYCVIYRDSWRERNADGSERKRETTCRVFAAPAERHFASDAQVAGELARLQPQWDDTDVLPNEAVPIGNDQRPHTYGMGHWVKMFSPRQQLAHGHCVQAYRECVDADEDGRASRRPPQGSMGLHRHRLWIR